MEQSGKKNDSVLLVLGVLVIAKYVLLSAGVILAWRFGQPLLALIFVVTMGVDYTDRRLSIWDIQRYVPRT